MGIAFQLLVLLHLVGFAALLGGYLVQLRAVEPEINAAIQRIVRHLTPRVQYIRYDVGEDWSGDWGIFFRVVLSDDASRSDLHQVTSDVARMMTELVDFNAMGVIPYFNFRSQSELSEFREPAWA